MAQTQLEEPLAWSKEWVPCLLETVQLLYRPEMVDKALISTLEELTWSPILFEELLWSSSRNRVPTQLEELSSNLAQGIEGPKLWTNSKESYTTSREAMKKAPISKRGPSRENQVTNPSLKGHDSATTP